MKKEGTPRYERARSVLSTDRVLRQRRYNRIVHQLTYLRYVVNSRDVTARKSFSFQMQKPLKNFDKQ